MNKLFDAARNAEPVVSLDESIEQFNKEVEGKETTSIYMKWLKPVIAVATLAVVGGGVYFLIQNQGQQNAEPSQENTVQTEQPAVQATETQPAATVEQPQSKDENIEAVTSSTKTEITNPTPIKNKVTHAVGANDNYIVETQTVNINNETGAFKISISDDVERIVLNGKEVEKSEWSKYQNEVAEAMAAKSSMGINKENAANKKFVDYMFSTLTENGLIKNNLSAIKLSNEMLLIEGQEADSAIHKQLLKEYKKITGNDLGFRTLYFN